jgi:hypothetical protein
MWHGAGPVGAAMTGILTSEQFDKGLRENFRKIMYPSSLQHPTPSHYHCQRACFVHMLRRPDGAERNEEAES